MRRVPLFAFLTANAIAFVGNHPTMIAVPWFVLETTGSAAKTGLVGFFTALPAILAAFFGGALVDRFGFKRMSITSDLASGATVAMIPLLFLTGGLQFWHLLGLVFLSALLDAPGNTARQALLPDIAGAAGVGLSLWVQAFGPPYPAIVSALFFAGLVAGPVNPLLMTVIQEHIPSELRGRVFGTITAVALIVTPLGMVLSGFAVERLSLTVTLIIIAASYLLVTGG